MGEKRGNYFRFSLKAFILIFGIVLFLGLINAFSSWTSPKVDDYRSGYSPLKGNITYPRIMWEFDYPNTTTNYIQNPVLIDDINNDGVMEACTAGGDAYVRCFIALNGTELFNYSVGGNPRMVAGQ